MNWFKKKIEKIGGYEVTTKGIWVVSWKARYGQYHTDHERVFMPFMEEEEAIKFRDDLKAAAKLLKYTENLGIKIEKQNSK